MAGTVTLTTDQTNQTITKYSLAWLSDAGGAVSATSVTLKPGTVVAVTFSPGSVTPTDLYDVTMTCDTHGTNILDDGAGASIGANLSNTVSTHKVPFIGGGAVTYVRQWLHGGGYTLVVAAAGATKTGTVDIYVSSEVI